MQCDHALLAVLDPDPPADAVWHTRSCPRCRAALVDVRRGRDVLSMAVTPPAGLEDQVVAAVTHARLEDEVVAAVASDVRRRRRLRVPMAAAAIAAAAAAVFVLAIRQDAPASHVVELSGTAAAPSARATVEAVEADGQTRFTVRASGLRPAPPGTYYEMVVSRTDGQDLSAGSFASAAAPVSLHAALRWEEWRSCVVTLRRAGSPGDPGTVVLEIPEGYVEH